MHSLTGSLHVEYHIWTGSPGSSELSDRKSTLPIERELRLPGGHNLLLAALLANWGLEVEFAAPPLPDDAQGRWVQGQLRDLTRLHGRPAGTVASETPYCIAWHGQNGQMPQLFTRSDPGYTGFGAAATQPLATLLGALAQALPLVGPDWVGVDPAAATPWLQGWLESQGGIWRSLAQLPTLKQLEALLAPER